MGTPLPLPSEEEIVEACSWLDELDFYDQVGERLALTGPGIQEMLDRLAHLAAHASASEIALVSLHHPATDARVLQAHVGPQAVRRKHEHMPLSRSFCSCIAEGDRPLVLSDVRGAALVRDRVVMPPDEMRAYLGVPIHDPVGGVVGTLAVACGRPRAWQAEDVHMLEEIAACVSDTLRLRASLSRD